MKAKHKEFSNKTNSNKLQERSVQPTSLNYTIENVLENRHNMIHLQSNIFVALFIVSGSSEYSITY